MSMQRKQSPEALLPVPPAEPTTLLFWSSASLSQITSTSLILSLGIDVGGAMSKELQSYADFWSTVIGAWLRDLTRNHCDVWERPTYIRHQLGLDLVLRLQWNRWLGAENFTLDFFYRFYRFWFLLCVFGSEHLWSPLTWTSWVCLPVGGGFVPEFWLTLFRFSSCLLQFISSSTIFCYSLYIHLWHFIHWFISLPNFC